MINLNYNGGLGPLAGGIGQGLGRFAVYDDPDGPVVFAASRADGGIVCIGFDATGRPQIIDQRYFAPAVAGGVDGRLDVVETNGAPLVVFGASGANQLVGYEIGTGGLGASVQVGGAGLAGPAGYQTGGLTAQTDNGFLFAANRDGSLRCFGVETGGNGTLNAGQVLWDSSETFHANPVGLAAVEVGGTSFLLTVCADTPGVSVFAVDDATGELSHTDAMGVQDGLGLHDTPVGIVTAEVAGETFAIVASSAQDSRGAALSVLRLDAQGQLRVSDHILDGLETRFGQVTGVATVSHDGWTYVVAAGGDQGVSLFALMPGGQLTLLDTLESRTGALVPGLSDVTAVVAEDQLSVLMTSHASAEVLSLSASLEGQGAVMVAGGLGEALTGTADRDMIIGGFGDDTLSGGAGHDILRDGTGADLLSGGGGRDRFVMEFDGARDVITDFNAAHDVLDLSLTWMLYGPDQIAVTTRNWGAELSYRGETLELRSADGGALGAADVLGAIDWGIDRPPLVLRMEIRGDNGADTLEGHAGVDLLYGLKGDDRLEGYDGDDFLNGDKGDDTVIAGSGNDTVIGDHGADVVWLQDGDDEFRGNDPSGIEHSDIVHGGAGADTIRGQGGDDRLSGGSGRDVLEGGSGADTLFGDEDGDTLQGGEGNDTLEGGAGDDALNGGSGDDSIDGGEGADLINAGTGQDHVTGGRGADLVHLNQGNDLFVDTSQGGAQGRDTVFAGYGDDTIEADGGRDELHGQWGADLIFGGADHDLVFGGDHNDTIHGGWGHDTVWGGNGRDLIYLGDGDDLFMDQAQNSVSGNDSVYGEAGNDTLQGAGGDDALFGGVGADLIYGGLGNDMIEGNSQSDTIHAGEGDDTVVSGRGPDLVYLNGGHDLFVDDAQGDRHGRDTIWGGFGDDTIEGAGGNDILRGQVGRDLLIGGLGNDSLFGGDQHDTIVAGAGDDRVQGGNGRDVVDLGDGDDRYSDTAQSGSLGQDTITGGAGADTFQFHHTMSQDVITDFERGVDLLMLDADLVDGRSAVQVISDFMVRTQAGFMIEVAPGQSILLEGVHSRAGFAEDLEIF